MLNPFSDIDFKQYDTPQERYRELVEELKCQIKNDIEMFRKRNKIYYPNQWERGMWEYAHHILVVISRLELQYD